MRFTSFQKGLLVALLVIVAFLSIIFVNGILLGDAFSKEEAQHAIYGLWLYKDIRALDFGAFWYDTQRQMFWPFLHSWFLSVTFFFFGVTFAAARFLSFLIFILTLFFIYQASLQLSRRSGPLIGLMAVALALSSPIMINYATQSTLEGLGALIFLVAYYFYISTEDRKSLINYVFLAILVGLSIYTNYLYAYFMIPAFLVVSFAKLGPVFVEVRALSKKGEHAAYPFLWWAYRKLIFITVLLVVAGAWFFTSAFARKFLLFLQAIFRYSGGESIDGLLPALFYYPRMIIEHYSFSPWLGLLIVVALFLPFTAFHYWKTNKLYTFIWTVLILATMTVPTKAPQFIYIIAPFLFMVAASSFFYFIEKYDLKAKRVLIALLLPALISLPALFGLYFPQRPAENMTGVLRYFRQSVLPRHPVAISVNLQHLNSEVVNFYFWDWNAPVLADTAAQEGQLFQSARYFFALELDECSPVHLDVLDDSLFRWNAFLSDKLKNNEVSELSMRHFASLGLTAKIYEKKTPLYTPKNPLY
ncbi:MAG: glycosyltransferase family 39 protein [Candidatus Margulisbacteria bacterium]|nr:glycosyltransferase family 39 protein [Candidatus Margulisiibacteriota bacterium]MBU1616465.1 glycosyltransferase family 39 protein [Candidatus Margulisiibacteriota bacterium]MBU1867717.1 glycosyltransferase family 39 protein [Candidatus Margulisiibacteriota bacterium]